MAYLIVELQTDEHGVTVAPPVKTEANYDKVKRRQFLFQSINS